MSTSGQDGDAPETERFDDPMFDVGCDGNEVRSITLDLIAAPVGGVDAGSPDGALNTTD